MITVAYLGHHNKRLGAHKIAFHYIKKIKEENKKHIQFLLQFNQDDEHWIELHQDLINSGVQSKLLKYNLFNPNGSVDNWNYMKKCGDALKRNSMYCCKMDEDVWMSTESWDWIIENIAGLFSHKDILAVSPIISTGIPTTDHFIRSNFTEEEQSVIKNLFYNETFGKIWEVDYTSLNKHRELSPVWNSSLFLNLVKEIKHHYKGVHPVRFSREAMIKINDFCLNNYTKIFENKPFSPVFIDKSVYLCNNLVFMTTENWTKIVQERSCWPPGVGMDEVPLNLYREKYDMKFAYINNMNAIHLFFNSLQDHLELESEYVEKYRKLIV